MSGRDERDPIYKEDQPAPGPSDQAEPAADLLAPSPGESPSAEPPAFHFPAIPIPPPKAINAPASRALASGDDLIDLAGDPLGVGASNPPRRVPIPDVLAPHPFAKALPSDPNQPVFQEPSTITRGDQLTEALRPETSEPDEAPAPELYSAPDFPITPIRPFAAPPHAEPAPDNTLGAPGPSHLGTWESNHDGSPGALAAPAQSSIAPPVFRLQPEPESRIPNFGHIAILAIFASLGFIVAAMAVPIALHFHLWGVKTVEQAQNDIHYTLASMAVLYIVSFAGAFFFFPLVWHKSFFAGLQWNASAAVRYLGWLFGAASFCFILALVDELILPSPSNAPIDKMFSSTAAAWLLFGFGVLVAPFFEEMTFRGFLLPALCTTCDWLAEYARSESQWSRPALIAGSAVASSALVVICEQKFGHHQPLEWLLVSCFIAVVCGLAISWLYQRYQALGAGSRVRPLGPNGHPRWSLAAIIVGSLLTSLPFAAMHAEQIAHSFGPLVLLYCVSLVLCFVRLATRSLAASTLVHASYNFLLFFFMLVGTGGFKHLDKM